MPDPSESSTSPVTAEPILLSPKELENSNIAKYIEDLTSLFPEAINARQFSAEKQPWTLFASTFRAEIPYFQQDKLNPEEYRAFWQTFTDQHVDFRIEVIHTDVFVSKKADMAECYMTWKSNSHSSIFLSATSKVTWRLDRNSKKWLSTNHVSLPGLVGTE